MAKKRILVFVLAAIAALCLGTVLTACGDEPAPPEVKCESMNMVVWGYEWGPGIPKVVLEMSGDVSEVAKDTFSIKTGGAKREVVDAYASDADGNKTTEKTKYVTVEMTVKYSEASPFTYSQATARNDWTASINVNVTVDKDFKVGSAVCEKGKKFNAKLGEDNRKVPQTASWKKDTVKHENITLQRASWAPKDAATDSGKNPLVIWLHGAGEGGTDIDIDLLGNEVTALTTENETNVQKYFATDGLAGAYVLAVQTPTMWMNDGSGEYNTTGTGKQESMYTAALMNAITSYVESNSDVDTKRIYIGGCSNGGYMTMNMAFEHGDYFAAFYPICQAYMNSRISDEMIGQIKDYNMWFLHSEDDGTVDPAATTIATYDRLLKAGAGNVHFTMTDHVRGTDDPNPAASWGTTEGCYMGHWVWIEALNDNVKKQFDNSKVTGAEYLTSANCTADGNLWQWLAAQKKA